MPLGTNAPKLWPAEPVKCDVDRVVGQALAAVAPGDLGAEHRADRAVDVADRQLDRAPAAPSSSARLAQRDQLLVERPVEPVVLRRSCRAASWPSYGFSGIVEDRREVEARAPSSGRPPRVVSSTSTWPTASAIERKPERGEVLAHLLGDELEEVHDELGLAGEALAQLGVLRGDADRAGVEVADAHHHAAATRRAARWRSRTPRRRAARR